MKLAAMWIEEWTFYPYVYRYVWGPRIKRWPKGSALKQLDRKGARCQVIARGAMNSALIEFEDGARAIVSRNALRRAVTAGAKTRAGGDIVIAI
jgi:hypothetical protein